MIPVIAPTPAPAPAPPTAPTAAPPAPPPAVALVILPTPITVIIAVERADTVYSESFSLYSKFMCLSINPQRASSGIKTFGQFSAFEQ